MVMKLMENELASRKILIPVEINQDPENSYFSFLLSSVEQHCIIQL